MNIWKKPAPSINTHNSGYSNGPQGPPPIPLPQGCSSNYTLHVCDELKIPSFQLPGKASCNTGVVPTTSGAEHFMTFTVLARAHIHTPCDQGGKPALVTPGSQFLHKDHQGELPAPPSHYHWEVIALFLWGDWQKVASSYSYERLIYSTQGAET